MNWMGCVATNVMGPRLVFLYVDSPCPLNRMLKVGKEVIVNIDGIVEPPKRNRSLLLGIYDRWLSSTTIKLRRPSLTNFDT